MLKDKKIVFVISQLRVGGAAKMIKYVANVCSNYFAQVSIVSYYDDYTPDDVNGCILRFNLDITLKNGIPLWRIKALRRLRAVLKEKNPDIVCSFLPDVSAMSLIAATGLNCKVVSAERGDPFEFSMFWKFLMKFVYRKSDFCFFQLPQARDFFGDSVSVHSFVIPNPIIGRNTIQPFDGNRKKTIVSAGRFEKQKRYDILLRAFAKVSQVYTDYTLVLYGEGGCLEEYKAISNDLGISNKVFFPGYVKNVAEAIREDGIFVLSSDYEGIPNSLIEAMSIGMPCIATDCTPGGPYFLTNGGKRGLLVPLHDVDKMANAIIFLIENPSIKEEYAKKALEVIEELNEEKIREKWLNSFKEILK